MRFARLAMVLTGIVFGLPAFGDPIIIFNTGESTGGTALAPGTADSHYTLVSAPSGVPLTAIATTQNASWTPNTATTDWISPGGNGGSSWPVGTYDYQITFDLTGLDASTAELSGEWTSDNNASISLNGVDTGITSSFGGFGSLSAFSITSGFQAGVNTLDFLVVNGGGPTGVIAEVSGTAASSGGTPPPTVPEPSSLTMVLLGSGLLLGVGSLRRRAQARQ